MADNPKNSSGNPAASLVGLLSEAQQGDSESMGSLADATSQQVIVCLVVVVEVLLPIGIANPLIALD
jgi:hypothetical protein